MKKRKKGTELLTSNEEELLEQEADKDDPMHHPFEASIYDPFHDPVKALMILRVGIANYTSGMGRL